MHSPTICCLSQHLFILLPYYFGIMPEVHETIVAEVVEHVLLGTDCSLVISILE